MTRLPIILAAALGAVAFANPAGAQDGPAAPAAAGNSQDRVNFVIVYGQDACPPSQGDEIVVCARKDESERFRIPKPLRNIGEPGHVAWAERAKSLEVVGRSGINSCSPSGPGGFTGCTQELIQKAYAERGQGSDVQAGRLIEEARRARLAKLDAEAAKTEAEVRRIEEEQRKLREQQAAKEESGKAQPAPASSSPPAPPPR